MRCWELGIMRLPICVIHCYIRFVLRRGAIFLGGGGVVGEIACLVISFGCCRRLSVKKV
ncbi:hypothetical protein J3E68DRAFT_410952 [Trichoderma sp. SZMC 28012]